MRSLDLGTRQQHDRAVTDVDGRLDRAILALLAERGPGKTICPSEAARAVAPTTEDGHEALTWRALMEPARRAAARLAGAGQIEVTQRGEVVDMQTAQGPVRLRLRSEAPDESRRAQRRDEPEP